mgnify:CR=1 FL=1
MHGPSSLLLADLGSRTCTVQRLPDETLRLFPGGRGLAGHLLRPFIHLPWDHPDMPVFFLAGPLAGTGAPCASRCHLASRSPLTGILGDDALPGGLGRELARAGFLGLMLTGRSAEPLGLEIRDAEVRLVDAAALKNQTTDKVFDALTDFHSAACVGPAAWHEARIAGVQVDRRFSAGRCGLGLSLAAKGLAYVAVSGSTDVPVHDPLGLGAARADIERLIHASPVLRGPLGFGRFGTAALLDLTRSRSMLPTDNFQRTSLPGMEHCNAPALARHFAFQPVSCPGCPVGCALVDTLGRTQPDVEALSHLTALLGLADPELAVAAGDLCAKLGLDPVSAAGALAAWAEITDQKLTTWTVLDLLEDAALGHGDGALLAQGARELARELERPGAAMAVKGLELSAFDPRGAMGLALGYAVGTRGACPWRAMSLSHELLRKPVPTDRFSWSGKARMVKLAEDMLAAGESLPVCRLAFLAAGLEEYAKAFAAVTGVPATAQDLALLGERALYQERLMNADLGVTAGDDDLPLRFFTEAGDPGQGFATPALDRAAFLEARARYYRVRGLDENGLPLRDKTEELGLAWTVR